MNIARIMAVAAAGAWIAGSAANVPPAEAAGKLPRVLLAGDSIAIYYEPCVTEMMKGVAQVKGSGQTGGTRMALQVLPDLLKGKYDVIHFNWGLHDLKACDASGGVSIEDYEKNLRELVKMLRATGARLVWASTTPVANAANDAEIVRYNAVAKKVMDENKIPIDDLYAVAKPQLAKIQKPDGMHFEPEGCRILAKSVVDSILAAGKAK